MKTIKEAANTCSAGLLKAGGTDALADTPEPDSISLRMPLIPSRSNVLAPSGDPLAQVESSRIKPCMHSSHKTVLTTEPKKRTTFHFTVYVDVLSDACPPPELLVEINDAACVTSP